MGPASGPPKIGPPIPTITTITVQGKEYELTPVSDGQILASAQIAATYAMQFLPGPPTMHANREAELTAKLHAFRNQLSRSAAEDRALADAQDFELSEEQLSRDITRLRELGSLDALINEHHRRHQQSGMNSDRIRKWLQDDPAMEKVLTISDQGVVADTDPNFRRTERTAPLRDLQRRLAPVYYKAAAGMHDTGKVLLFRVTDLTPEERREIHMANEYHWRPEPGKVAGRPLMDCSNAAPGAIPLNTEKNKLSNHGGSSDITVLRYQRFGRFSLNGTDNVEKPVWFGGTCGSSRRISPDVSIRYIGQQRYPN